MAESVGEMLARDAASPATEGYRPYSGFWIRLVAYIADGAILQVGALLMMAGVAFVATAATSDAVVLVAYYLLICVLGHTLYYAVLTARTGQTPGKALLGLRVEMPDGSIPSFGVALGRVLSFDLCLLGTVAIAGLADPVVLAVRRDKRSLHDLMAGTVVRMAPPARYSNARSCAGAVVILLVVLNGLDTPLSPRSLAKRYVCQVHQVRQAQPSELALGTFRPGDRLLVNGLAYRRHDPRSGDVAMYDDSSRGGAGSLWWLAFSALRPTHVVGVAGDRVRAWRGQVWCNGKPIADLRVPPDRVWPQSGQESVVEPGSVALLADGNLVPGIVPRWRVCGQVVSVCWPPPRMKELRQSGEGRPPGPPRSGRPADKP